MYWKLVKLVLNTLIEEIGFNVIPQNVSHVRQICRMYGKIDLNVRSDIGEISLTPHLEEPDVVFASSDGPALKAFRYANRVDPRFDPAKTASVGEDFDPDPELV